MTHYQRKPYAGRHKEESEQRHWLEEGVAGQESLLLELDAWLYALDQPLAAIASGVAHACVPRQERPFAVFIPLYDTIGWQLASLSKHYNVYLWSENGDELLTRAANVFGAEIVDEDLLGQLEHEVDFFLCSNYVWTSEQTFKRAVRNARASLSREGRACFVLRGTGAGEDISVVWREGTSTALAEILAAEPAALPPVAENRLIALKDADPVSLLPAFLKRNRDFFGRNMRELFLQRMQEEDFGKPFERRSGEWALLLVWSR